MLSLLATYNNKSFPLRWPYRYGSGDGPILPLYDTDLHMLLCQYCASSMGSATIGGRWGCVSSIVSDLYIAGVAEKESSSEAILPPPLPAPT